MNDKSGVLVSSLLPRQARLYSARTPLCGAGRFQEMRKHGQAILHQPPPCLCDVRVKPHQQLTEVLGPWSGVFRPALKLFVWSSSCRTQLPALGRRDVQSPLSREWFREVLSSNLVSLCLSPQKLGGRNSRRNQQTGRAKETEDPRIQRERPSEAEWVSNFVLGLVSSLL